MSCTHCQDMIMIKYRDVKIIKFTGENKATLLYLNNT
jgi:hypothetical protein